MPEGPTQRQGTSAATGHGPLLLPMSLSNNISNNNNKKTNDQKKNMIRNNNNMKNKTENNDILHLLICLALNTPRGWRVLPCAYFCITMCRVGQSSTGLYTLALPRARKWSPTHDSVHLLGQSFGLSQTVLICLILSQTVLDRPRLSQTVLERHRPSWIVLDRIRACWTAVPRIRPS